MSRFIPQKTIDDQWLASDPAGSAWVSANAGSGKTHVLAQRVKRLLLMDIEPSRILCLTYTRAAAANMSNRVFDDLAKWVLMDDAALDAAIAETGGKTGTEERKLARKLFARALETPGGLKIQTIHAFCEAVLHQFPLEANIAGHFELLDSEKEAALVAEARRDMISVVAAGGEPALADAFADVLDRVGEGGLDRLLGEIVRRRDGLRRFISEIEVGGADFAPLFEEFGFGGGDSEASIAVATWPLPGLDADAFAELSSAAQASGAKRLLESMLPATAAAFSETDPVRRLTLASQGLLKKDGEPYAASIFTKAVVARLPDIVDLYDEAAARLSEVADRLATFRMVSATRSALVLADWLIRRYERLKSARGFLDFNDLITRTAALLGRDEARAWVHFKLDQGIDHILVDEAQDTSPVQWEVIKRLAEEFFSGAGAGGERARTVFAVGDEKQSIYSFQGAEPNAFKETQFAFAGRVQAVDGAFNEVKLHQSFRSTRDVLAAVDLVFSDPQASAGLQRDPEKIEHDGVREGESGLVEVWSSLGAAASQEPDDWTEAIDEASAPAVRLAATIADTIKSWVGRELIDGEQPRLIRPGDVMVLVRKRDAFVHALSRALKDKSRNIPVAGADRLVLTDHLAIKDLVAIGRFVQQPHDDLSLAALLRSPIFGWSDDDLFALAHKRGDVSLFGALERSRATDATIAGVAAEIEEWRNTAAFRSAFDFYAGLLAGTRARTGLRSRLIARLGAEAGDVIDEFLTFCRAAEETGGGELESLLATLDRAPPEVKREMEQGRDEVRVLTVHASKGLEAPIVFLVDPGSKPFHDSHLPEFLPTNSTKRAWQGEGYLWQPRKELANTAIAAIKADLKAKAEAEYRRLLYVGMTRARDRLIVCGYHGARAQLPDTWQQMVERALAASEHAQPLEAPEACLPAWRFRVTTPSDRIPVAEQATATDDTFAPLPPLAPPPAPPLPLRPSGAGLSIETDIPPNPDGRSPVLDAEVDASLAREKGTATHLLLQVLPDLPAPERENAARRYIERAASDWPPSEREALTAAVARVLADPALMPLFADGSRAEVGLAGTLKLNGRDFVVSGKVDRLRVTDDSVTIVDYKTGRPPEGEPPSAHVAQVALYAALLRQIYPEHRVEALLLYTAGPLAVRVGPGEIDAALARLATS